jgi:hypothetical protein
MSVWTDLAGIEQRDKWRGLVNTVTDSRVPPPPKKQKFWEELSAYFPFTTMQKKTFVCKRNKANKNIIWQPAMLVLLVRVIFGVRRWNGLRCRDIHTKFHEVLFSHWSNLRLQCWCYWWRGLTWYAFEIASRGMTYISNFTKIGSGVQKLLAGIYI